MHTAQIAPHVRFVLQTLPLAGVPIALQVMLRQFPSARRFTFNGDPARVRSFAALPAEERAGHEVLSGLVHFGIDELLPEPATYITMLRDPVRSAIGFYYQVLAAPDHYLHPLLTSRNWSLREFVAARRPEIDNPMVRWLNPEPPSKITFGGVTRAMLETAKKNLEERCLFGLAERLDETLIYFRAVLGWRDVRYCRNGAPSDPDPAAGVDEETLEQIRIITRFDIELYEFARDLFDRRLAEVSPDLEADLAAYRAENRSLAESGTWIGGAPISPCPDEPDGAPVPQDVVWLASYPRSGNTWLRFLLDSYFFSPARSMQEIGRLTGELDWWVQEAARLGHPERWIAHAGTQVRDRYPRPAGFPSDLIYKTHFIWSAAHPLAARTQRVVYLIRHPRDVLLSGINFADLTSEGPGVDPRQYAAEFIRRGGDAAWMAMGYGTWARHAESWLERKDVPVLLVRYEDLKADTFAEFRRILGFIGAPLDDERIRRAIEHSSFGRLRTLEVASRAVTDLSDLKNREKFFFHKGLSGQSLAHLGADLDEEFTAGFGPALARWGYKP